MIAGLAPAASAAPEAYTACGCGCCGGVEPEEKCLYRSKKDDLQRIIAEDKRIQQSLNCAVMGCSRGIRYTFCDDLPARLGRPFRLRVGETAAMKSESMKITFARVEEDSRCPPNGVCKWEGRVVVRLLLALRGREAGEVELIARAGHPELASKAVEGYLIRLKECLPPPSSERPLKPEDYVAIVVVDKSRPRSP